MQTTEVLKGEIISALDRLPLVSLRTVAEFVAFLVEERPGRWHVGGDHANPQIYSGQMTPERPK